MNKLLAKIFNLNRNGSQSNGTSSVGLLRQIDRLVLFNTEKIINEVNLHDHFISLISDLEIAGEKKVLLQYSELSGTANWFDVAEGQREVATDVGGAMEQTSATCELEHPLCILCCCDRPCDCMVWQR